MLYSTRGSWETLIIPLVEAGYAVLSVDLRGHGETGGTVDWKLADQDIQNWIDWLSQQPGIDPNGINLIGASIGGNLALRGIAANEQIVTSIALSPGLDYQGVTTEDVMKGLPRPIFLAVAQDDGSASSVKKLAGMVGGAGLVRYYTGSRHGTQLLNVPDLIPTMIFWLDLYNQAN
jgi:pimeloyl-ACP methyl ester carboxylesterase